MATVQDLGRVFGPTGATGPMPDIDSSLSYTSTNTVQNKAVASAILTLENSTAQTIVAIDKKFYMDGEEKEALTITYDISKGYPLVLLNCSAIYDDTSTTLTVPISMMLAENNVIAQFLCVNSESPVANSCLIGVPFHVYRKNDGLIGKNTIAVTGRCSPALLCIQNNGSIHSDSTYVTDKLTLMVHNAVIVRSSKIIDTSS